MATTTLTLSYTVDAAQASDIISTIAAQLGYVANQDQTASQYLKQAIGNKLKELYVAGKVNAATQTAAQAANTDAQAVSIT